MLRQNCSVNYLKLTLKKRLSILYIFATILDKLVYLNLNLNLQGYFAILEPPLIFSIFLPTKSLN